MMAWKCTRPRAWNCLARNRLLNEIGLCSALFLAAAPEAATSPGRVKSLVPPGAPPYQIWAAPLVCMTTAFLGLTYLAPAHPHRRITIEVS
jgi:hypothetical protein